MTNAWPRAAILAVSFVLLGSGMPLRADERPQVHKKFVEFGWDSPTTAFLREHWQQMEATTPFDGVVFKVEAKDDHGQPILGWHSWDATPWKRQWFQPAIADLQACKFTKFTDNFVLFLASPGTVDWNDDKGWDVLAEKMAISAWIAREGGAKGLALDFEMYGKQIFHFNAKEGRTFAATCALVRKRGAQAMQSIAREYPHATLLPFFLNSINIDAGNSNDPDAVLATANYGLLPAFINGMLDAMPRGMTLVDGCESGYYFNAQADFLTLASGMRSPTGAAVRLVASENRAKWQAQGQAGFGVYIDSYLNPAGSTYYFGPTPGRTRLDRFREGLSSARSASDQYVWVYGEQCKWWDVRSMQESTESFKKSVGHGQRWEEAIPGITAAIVSARGGQAPASEPTKHNRGKDADKKR